MISSEKNSLKRNGGFTLFELLITLSILAILSASAVPSLFSSIQRGNSKAYTMELHSALRQTWITAIDRGKKARICASTDGLSCATNTDWGKGYAILVDTADDGTYSTLIHGSTGIPEDLAITVKDSSDNDTNHITFSSLGVLSGGATGYVYKVVPKDCRGSNSRSIVVTFAGKASHDWVDCP